MIKSLLRFNKIARTVSRTSAHQICSTTPACGIRWEPPYLDDDPNETPTYPLLNVQVKGYDFCIIESYEKWIHKIARSMKIDVKTAFATPCQVTNLKRFKDRSSKVECEYTIRLYERNVQIEDLPSTMAPTFFEVVQAALPEGVSLSIHEHMVEHEQERYIPDLELKALEDLLEELGGPLEPKKN